MGALAGASSVKKSFVGTASVKKMYRGSTLLWSGVDPLAFTEPQDTPIVTYAAVGASVAPTIAGSAGWMREKRVGVAENVPGASQSSTADLDLSGSTRFRYSSFPSAAGHSANAGQYVLSGYKPGSTAALQSAKWLFNIATLTSSKTVEIRLRAGVANPTLGIIKVNGRRVRDFSFSASGITAGSGYAAKLSFPTEAPRRIVIEGLGGVDGTFGGMAVEAGHTLVKPAPTTKRRVAVLADSYGNGAGNYGNGGANSLETFVWDLGLLMDADEIIQAGIGSTGFIATLSGQPTSNFMGRVPDLLAMAPDVLVIAGGRNDAASTNAAIQAAAEALLDAVRGIPAVYMTRTSATTSTGVNAALAAACASRGVPFLDVDIDALPKIADGIHLSFDGHRQFARRLSALGLGR